MKQNNLIIAVATILILAIVAFMAYDFFWEGNSNEKNNYEYSLDDFLDVDTSLINYNEVLQFKPLVNKMKGIAVDASDNIFVVGEGQINVFDNNGNVENDIITNTSGRCIALGIDNLIYLGAEDHIEVWNPDGTLISKWETVNENSIITSIAVNDHSVFASDAGNKLVYHYNLEGELMNEIGRKDTVQGIQGFIIPSPYFDIALGRDGELWAVNSGRHQFESYSPDGKLISSWKKTSMQLDGFSGCCNPSHFAFLPDGSYVTSEKGIVRIKVHDPTGRFKSVVAASDQFDKGTTGLDIAVDSKGRVIVLDPKRQLIRIFERK